jgi:4-amino-4-deoxy-L-arabinose transferase-like glycosyltransferase
VSQTVATNKPLDSPREVPLGACELHAIERESFVEGWLQHHLNAVAMAVVAAAFVIRLVIASRSFLNPDEALHYLLFDQQSAFLAYKASLSNAHPPLLFLTLYFWHLLGHSEIMLRLPSVFAGTAFCWFTFKWMEISFSRTASLISLIVVAFSPTLIGLSAELREYSLLLFFMAAALYYLEEATQEKSVRKMWYFSVAFYLAILSHYSAVFFVLAMGAYALVRIADAQLPRKVIATWVIGQMGAVAIYGILYVTHISKLKGSIPLWAGTYNRFYFYGGFADIFGFLREFTPYIFRYIFGQVYIGHIMVLFWVVGVAILFLRGLRPGHGYSRSSQLGILLLLPFMALWGAVIAGKYPYVPSRHTVFLAPFAIAAVSALLASVSGQKLWRGLLIAALLMGVTSVFGASPEKSINAEDQKRTLMNAALHYVHQSILPNDLILMDYQSSLPIAYYVCAPAETREFYTSEREFTRLNCSGHSFVALNYRSWELNDINFSPEFERLVHQFDLKPGDRVWVFQTTWVANLDSRLQRHFPKFRCLAPKRFGQAILIVPFVVSSELLPACAGDRDSASESK